MNPPAIPFGCIVLLLPSSDTEDRAGVLLRAQKVLDFLPVVLVVGQGEQSVFPGFPPEHVFRQPASVSAFEQKKALSAWLWQRGLFRPVIWLAGSEHAPLVSLFRETMILVWQPAVTKEIPLRETDLAVFPHAVGPEYAGPASIVWAGDADAQEFVHQISTLGMRPGRKNVLVLYCDRSTHVSTVREYLESFAQYSKHQVFFVAATNKAKSVVDVSAFDAVVIHYSVRLSIPNHLSPAYAQALESYWGPKILMIQDEYENTDTARGWIRRLGIDHVFTCVPDADIHRVYPPAGFPGVRFFNTFTGWVPNRYKDIATRDPQERPILIGYRGRPLPFWYGRLGQEKIEIGRRMREICKQRGLPVDIEWSEQSRIYGEAWYGFVQNCRAMLGTESGSNVFDDQGLIRKGITEALRKNPKLTFEDAHRQFIGSKEGDVVMNQVSPKIFEAIAFHTALILFEGDYSGVVQPWVHYIPLKKDFSNVDEVLAKVQDGEAVRVMTQRAYEDVILSEKYTYQRFIEGFDLLLDGLGARPRTSHFAVCVVGETEGKGAQAAGLSPVFRDFPSTRIVDRRNTPARSTAELQELMEGVDSVFLMKQILRRLWRKTPASIRDRAAPLLDKLKR